MNPLPESGDRLECAEQAGTLRARVGADGSPDKGTRHVLIVDDEQNILSSLRRLLRRESYEVITAGSGEEALKVMEERPADVVISDYRMPGMAGTDLLREIQNRWPDTVRIVLSGYSEVTAIIAAINEGSIYKFITKPWNDEEILLNVRRAVEQFELVAENRRMAQEIVGQNEQLRELNRLLDQRADDAATGLGCVQEVLESIDAGLIIIDQVGLIVGANRRASEFLATEGPDLIGTMAQVALPDELFKASQSSAVPGNGNQFGWLLLGHRKLQWRARAIGNAHQDRGVVLTLWEEVS